MLITFFFDVIISHDKRLYIYNLSWENKLKNNV